MRSLDRPARLARHWGWERPRGAWRRIPRAGRLIALLALFNALAWMLIVPPGHLPDEDQQIAYAQYLAETGKLPIDQPGRSFSPESDQTWGALRLYTQIGRPYEPALWARSQEESLRAVEAQNLPHVGAGDAEAAVNNPPLYYLAAAVPYRIAEGGTFLDRVYAMRLVSVLLAAFTALFAYLFVREALPRHEWAWTVGGAVVAFQPLFAFMSSGVHPDNMANTFAALELFLIARMFRLGLTPRRGAALGLALAGGLLSKAVMAVFVPVLAWALLVVVVRQRAQLRESAKAIGATVLAAAVPLGTYFVLTATVWSRDLYPGKGFVTTGAGGSGRIFSWTEYLSFTWQLMLPRLGFMTDLIPGVPIRDTFLSGLVGRFGWLDYAFSPRVDRWAEWLCAGVAVLIVAAAVRSRRALWRRLPEIVAYGGAVVGLFAIIGWASYRARLDGQSAFEQARYVLPLLGLYGLGVAVATTALGRWGRVLGAALIMLAVGHDIAAQLLTVQRFYS
jgi:4-amino-4-deoxy-L-arabinose transferase-like glycosyltransferase